MTRTSYERGERMDQPMFTNAYIAPDGAMYFCTAGPNGNPHTDTADILAERLLGIDAEWCGDILTDLGWIEVSTGHKGFYSDAIPVRAMADSVTPAQLDTMFAVLQDAETRPTVKAETIENMRVALGMERE